MKAIYDKNTLEFVTVAFEFCSWLERDTESDLFKFVDNATKLLPLLYLKASLIPLIPDVEDEDEDESEMAHFITEETYDALRTRIAGLLGEYDGYLETFLPDMAYSDTPIIAFISENIADMYQDIGNFVFLFRQGHEQSMLQSLSLCAGNFRLFWGQSLLNALKALHAVRYNEDIHLKTEEEV
ncbi:MAG: DUF5063 domain-containing protein [Tannerella sp.]|jgi:hypothetical protein|nr:DUF5063 domain-containing protein [Tannerella sp.]